MQTVDVLVDMYILSAPGARALGMAVYHILREALQVCSFSYDGQYQSLDEWDEQTVRLSRFFFINQSNANEVGPAAPKTNYDITHVYFRAFSPNAKIANSDNSRLSHIGYRNPICIEGTSVDKLQRY